MNYRLTCCVILTLTFTLFATAQGTKAPSRGTPTSTSSPTRMPTQPSLSGNDSSLGQRAFLTGKVVLDDGTQLTESASVQTLCSGRKQTVAHTDSHGGFSFELGDRTSAVAAGISDADVDSSGAAATGRGIQRDWRNCELVAELPGFTSQSIDLSSRLSTFESADIGRLVLHRLGHVEGLTISATSAAAPRDAQKAYEKGREKASKQKWDEAEQSLAKAVEIYPKYAVAWYDLGRVQLHKNDAVQARHSFEQSIAADPKYANPYRGIAELETQQKQWQALVNVTGQLLALNPVNFPDAWFRNALGNYYLHNFAEAEKSARQGMKVDDQHQLPRMEYLLGVILVQERNYPEAATHIQNYLKVATEPAEIEDAQKQLAEVSRLSASVSDPPAAAGDKK
jgi:tetratricopeptide (TPR) repeat protein